MRICKVCAKEKPLKLFAKNGKSYRSRCRECEASTQRKKIQVTMEYLISFKTKCCLCGYNKCKSALEFHHLDSKTKEFNLTQYAGRRAFTENTKLMIDREIKKCVILCANCHREIHEELINL